MNVKIITRHSPSNYGSLLQSIALQNVLENFGCDVEIIDYQRKDERGLHMVLTQLRQKKISKNPIMKWLYVIIRFPIEIYAQTKFDKMRKRYLKMTTRCSIHSDLEKLHSDVFMTGSDQVWGPMMNGVCDSAYFLDFVHSDAKKVAYAASFGKTIFDESLVPEFSRMLSSYDIITVREKHSIQILNNWRLNNCAGQVLDPSLLLNQNEWVNKYISINDLNKYKGKKYVLLYLIHNHSEHSIYANHFAKHVGMKLIRVNPFMHQIIDTGKFICCPDLSEFLSLILNATYIVTDSFHGTCFAINFNKQFIELLPKNVTSVRNQSLLVLTDLLDRIVTDYRDYSLSEKKIDYNRVNKILVEQNDRSKSILHNMVGQ